MSWILWCVLAIAVFFILAALKRGATSTATVGVPYQRGQALFSAAERSFLGVLDQAVGPEHRVFGKVRVADIAAVNPGLGNAARQGALNRIAAKHFDFVVCHASDLSPICVVELNDKSHASRKAQVRDELLANVCRAIDLPLLTVTAKAAYSLQDVRAQFLAAAASAPARARVGH